MPYRDNIRIAVIDDDEADYFIINDYIKDIEGKTFVVEWFKDYASAIQKIREKCYHIYFVDYFLGSKTGLDFLREAASLQCDDPIVLLTGFGSKSIDISAMQSGATDYLVKSDLSTEKLERCIRYSLDRTNFLRQLKERENKYRNLFQTSKDAVFITDQDLDFTDINPAALQLLGCTAESIKGRNLQDFLQDASQKEQIGNLLNAGTTINDLEIKIRNDKQELKDGLLSLTEHRDGEEEPHLHGIIHDITNSKQVELANLQTEKLAANERLIRTLAHEIRNPLNNIMLSVEQLMPEDENDGQRDYLDIVKRNSIRINHIITELLNMSRPGVLALDDVPLQEVLDDSLAQVADRMELQKINIKKNYIDEPVIIQADRSRLTMAFTNILINGIEAMKENGTLTVTMGSDRQNNVVTIRDDGKGIAAEHLSKVFDPFFTLKKNGMGLGLTASYSTIQSHNAKVQVESVVNEGTTFKISFKKEVEPVETTA